MKDLAEELDTRMERLGFEKEKRAFRPHITLARARDTRIDASLVDRVRAISRSTNSALSPWTASFSFKSTLKPSARSTRS